MRKKHNLLLSIWKGKGTMKYNRGHGTVEYILIFITLIVLILVFKNQLVEWLRAVNLMIK